MNIDIDNVKKLIDEKKQKIFDMKTKAAQDFKERYFVLENGNVVFQKEKDEYMQLQESLQNLETSFNKFSSFREKNKNIIEEDKNNEMELLNVLSVENEDNLSQVHTIPDVYMENGIPQPEIPTSIFEEEKDEIIEANTTNDNAFSQEVIDFNSEIDNVKAAHKRLDDIMGNDFKKIEEKDPNYLLNKLNAEEEVINSMNISEIAKNGLMNVVNQMRNLVNQQIHPENTLENIALTK